MATQKQFRLDFIDAARGLAVVFMIAVHTLEAYTHSYGQATWLGQAIEFLGGMPAAPVFVTLMGFSFAIAKPKPLGHQLKRGVKLIVAGYGLNLMRGSLPLWLAKMSDAAFLQQWPLAVQDEILLLMLVDILQFAGIAYIILALLKGAPKLLYLVLSGICLMVAPYLWGAQFGLPVIDWLLELFVGDAPIGFAFLQNKVAFPVLPWLAFPLLGAYLGLHYKARLATGTQAQSLRWFTVLGALLFSLGLLLCLQNPDYQFNDYFHSREGAMLLMQGFVILWLCALHGLTRFMADSAVMGLLRQWSQGVTVIYIAQWILIIWCLPLFGLNANSIGSTLLLIVGFTFASHWLNIWAQKRGFRI